MTRSAAKASVHRRRYVSRRVLPTCSRGRFLVSKASSKGEYDGGRPVPHLPVEVPDRRRKGHGPRRPGALYVVQERLPGQEAGGGWPGFGPGNDHRPVRPGGISRREGSGRIAPHDGPAAEGCRAPYHRSAAQRPGATYDRSAAQGRRATYDRSAAQGRRAAHDRSAAQGRRAAHDGPLAKSRGAADHGPPAQGGRGGAAAR